MIIFVAGSIIGKEKLDAVVGGVIGLFLAFFGGIGLS
jgi:hypothetical protein